MLGELNWLTPSLSVELSPMRYTGSSADSAAYHPSEDHRNDEVGTSTEVVRTRQLRGDEGNELRPRPYENGPRRRGNGSECGGRTVEKDGSG